MITFCHAEEITLDVGLTLKNKTSHKIIIIITNFTGFVDVVYIDDVV